MPVESLMDVDIPECETWYHKENGEIFPDDKMSGHGYKMVNKFVASGAHLSGKNVVSCEEITNTRFVFNETLERIKITGDLSNLSGVTHPVLHGYNYSPAEAPFPGWVRYGTFYNERNPLWRFFPEWISYKARLSTVLRNSEMQTDIALMQPLVDMWTYLAPQFEPSPGKWRPFYVNTLWEAVHQNGGGCDYLTESILQRSTFAAATRRCCCSKSRRSRPRRSPRSAATPLPAARSSSSARPPRKPPVWRVSKAATRRCNA